MIVEHGQRMTAGHVQGHVALEVHLPQFIRLRPLKAGEGGCRTASSGPSSTPCRFRIAVTVEGAGTAPCPRSSAAWRSCAPPRPDADRAVPAPAVSGAGEVRRGLVCGRRDRACNPASPSAAYAPATGSRSAGSREATTQLDHAHFHRHANNKLPTLIQHGHHLPRHRSAPAVRRPMCPRCLRTPVRDVSGLYTPCWGGRPRGIACQGLVVTIQTGGPSAMELKRIAIDTSKHVFTLHGVDRQDRVVLRRRPEAVAGGGVLCQAGADGGGAGGVRRLAPLGRVPGRAGPPGAADPAAIRQAVRQARQERPQRRRGDQRGGVAAGHARLCR